VKVIKNMWLYCRLAVFITSQNKHDNHIFLYNTIIVLLASNTFYGLKKDFFMTNDKKSKNKN